VSVQWSGVFPAATTHLHDDQSLDLESTMRHNEIMLQAGITGIIVLGSVGENVSMEYDEKLKVVEAAVEWADGRIPVLTGVAEYTTALACRYARDAQRIGVDGLMVLPAMVYNADPREALTHFRTVARASDLPVMIYNNPPAYRVDVTPEMFTQLADEPTIVAIKESSDNVRRITDIINVCGNRYILFCGVDDLILEAVMLGANGWVAGLVNAFPVENQLLWELAAAGRFAEARALYRWYTPLLHLDTHTKLVQYIKLAEAETGLGTETVRAPRLPIVGEERERVLGLIRKAIATRPQLEMRSPQIPG
jgi:dihydrodipicolinate synthase/N-acetylneuraminate lyase